MIKLPTAAKALVRATAPIPHRALISVTGPEATQWLNGILSSTVPNPPRGHFYSAFLNAQAGLILFSSSIAKLKKNRFKGRILHDVFVYARPDYQGYLIEHDSRSLSESIPPLLSALRQFVLRAKVKLRDVSEDYDVWAAWGSEHETHWETERRWSRADRSNIVEPLWHASSSTSTSPWGVQDLVLRDRRAVGMGHRLLIRRGERREFP
jgi:transferase CAF17, mitochondrial